MSPVQQEERSSSFVIKMCIQRKIKKHNVHCIKQETKLRRAVVLLLLLLVLRAEKRDIPRYLKRKNKGLIKITIHTNIEMDVSN